MTATDASVMGLALTHFAVGAILMQLILLGIAPGHPYRRSLVIVSGCWALLPDLHYVSPVYRDALSQLKFTVFGDLFWFHRFLDAAEPGRGSRTTAAVAVVLLLVITLLVDRFETGATRS